MGEPAPARKRALREAAERAGAGARVFHHNGFAYVRVREEDLDAVLPVPPSPKTELSEREPIPSEPPPLLTPTPNIGNIANADLSGSDVDNLSDVSSLETLNSLTPPISPRGSPPTPGAPRPSSAPSTPTPPTPSIPPLSEREREHERQDEFFIPPVRLPPNARAVPPRNEAPPAQEPMRPSSTSCSASRATDENFTDVASIAPRLKKNGHTVSDKGCSFSTPTEIVAKNVRKPQMVDRLAPPAPPVSAGTASAEHEDSSEDEVIEVPVQPSLPKRQRSNSASNISVRPAPPPTERAHHGETATGRSAQDQSTAALARVNAPGYIRKADRGIRPGSGNIFCIGCDKVMGNRTLVCTTCNTRNHPARRNTNALLDILGGTPSSARAPPVPRQSHNASSPNANALHTSSAPARSALPAPSAQPVLPKAHSTPNLVTRPGPVRRTSPNATGRPRAIASPSSSAIHNSSRGGHPLPKPVNSQEKAQNSSPYPVPTRHHHATRQQQLATPSVGTSAPNNLNVDQRIVSLEHNQKQAETSRLINTQYRKFLSRLRALAAPGSLTENDDALIASASAWIHTIKDSLSWNAFDDFIQALNEAKSVLHNKRILQPTVNRSRSEPGIARRMLNPSKTPRFQSFSEQKTPHETSHVNPNPNPERSTFRSRSPSQDMYISRSRSSPYSQRRNRSRSRSRSPSRPSSRSRSSRWNRSRSNSPERPRSDVYNAHASNERHKSRRHQQRSRSASPNRNDRLYKKKSYRQSRRRERTPPHRSYDGYYRRDDSPRRRDDHRDHRRDDSPPRRDGYRDRRRDVSPYARDESRDNSSRRRDSQDRGRREIRSHQCERRSQPRSNHDSNTHRNHPQVQGRSRLVSTSRKNNLNPPMSEEQRARAAEFIRSKTAQFKAGPSAALREGDDQPTEYAGEKPFLLNKRRPRGDIVGNAMRDPVQSRNAPDGQRDVTRHNRLAMASSRNKRSREEEQPQNQQQPQEKRKGGNQSKPPRDTEFGRKMQKMFKDRPFKKKRK